jgi:predicted enzyme related to lactoylglutathione lyase
MKKMNPVVHFEIPYENGDRIAKFYQNVFGWQIKKLGMFMGNYILATTVEPDHKEEKSGHPKLSGGINGGFYPKSSDKPQQYPSIVIAVENIEESMKNAIKEGGKVLGEPMDIPTVGRYVSIVDTEGNRVSMLQPS